MIRLQRDNHPTDFKINSGKRSLSSIYRWGFWGFAGKNLVFEIFNMLCRTMGGCALVGDTTRTDNSRTRCHGAGGRGGRGRERCVVMCVLRAHAALYKCLFNSFAGFVVRLLRVPFLLCWALMFFPALPCG